MTGEHLSGTRLAEVLSGADGDDRLHGADVFRIASREDSYRTGSESFAGLGDGRDGTLTVRVNDAGTRTYLESFEADAEGRRFEVALDGDHGDLSAEDFFFAAPVATAIELIGVV